jgi:hypothetical protein
MKQQANLNLYNHTVCIVSDNYSLPIATAMAPRVFAIRLVALHYCDKRADKK